MIILVVTLACFFLICDDDSLIRQHQRILAIYVTHAERSLNQGNLSLFCSRVQVFLAIFLNKFSNGVSNDVIMAGINYISIWVKQAILH